MTVPIQAVTVRMRRELEEKDQTAKGGAGSDVTVSAKDKEKGKEELQGVFVVRNGRATFVQVESGIMGSTDIEILKGVQPGDVIVTGSFSVLRTLKNNTKVRIDNTPGDAGYAGNISGPGIRQFPRIRAGGAPTQADRHEPHPAGVWMSGKGQANHHGNARGHILDRRKR